MDGKVAISPPPPPWETDGKAVNPLWETDRKVVIPPVGDRQEGSDPLPPWEMDGKVGDPPCGRHTERQ